MTKLTLMKKHNLKNATPSSCHNIMRFKKLRMAVREKSGTDLYLKNEQIQKK